MVFIQVHVIIMYITCRHIHVWYLYMYMYNYNVQQGCTDIMIGICIVADTHSIKIVLVSAISAFS